MLRIRKQDEPPLALEEELERKILLSTLNEYHLCGTYKNFGLEKANFQNGWVVGASFISCELVGANFSNADVSQARFIDCNKQPSAFNATRFEDAVGLNSVTFNGSTLNVPSFTPAQYAAGVNVHGAKKTIGQGLDDSYDLEMQMPLLNK